MTKPPMEDALLDQAAAPAKKTVQMPVGAIDRSRDQDALTKAAGRDASVPPHTGP